MGKPGVGWGRVLIRKGGTISALHNNAQSEKYAAARTSTPPGAPGIGPCGLRSRQKTSHHRSNSHHHPCKSKGQRVDAFDGRPQMGAQLFVEILLKTVPGKTPQYAGRGHGGIRASPRSFAIYDGSSQTCDPSFPLLPPGA